jgi:hypothetical protein
MVARSIGATPWSAGGRRPRCACTSARRVDRAICRRGRSGRNCPPGIGPRTATNAVQRRAQACDQRWLRVRKGHPIWSAGATTLLCDDETGEPRWHRGHRRRPETAAPRCGGVSSRCRNRVDVVCVRTLGCRAARDAKLVERSRILQSHARLLAAGPPKRGNSSPRQCHGR